VHTIADAWCGLQPMEHCVMQNNAINIYQTFFEDCELLNSSDYEQPDIKIVCTFK